MAVDATSPVALQVPMRSQDVPDIALERQTHLHAGAGRGTATGDAAVVEPNSPRSSSPQILSEFLACTEALPCRLGRRIGIVLDQSGSGMQRIFGGFELILACYACVCCKHVCPIARIQIAT